MIKYANGGLLEGRFDMGNLYEGTFTSSCPCTNELRPSEHCSGSHALGDCNCDQQVIYCGSWRHGSRNGKGILQKYSGKEVYDGDWVNDRVILHERKKEEE